MGILIEWKYRTIYWFINKLDKNKEVHFLNFGYSDAENKIALEPGDEKNRYSIQLYHHLSEEIDLTCKDIVEIGCGRGGGLAYCSKIASPASSIGIDIDRGAVDFANGFYNIRNLSFMTGDAHNIPLADNSCDVLFSVESSHRYPGMDIFLSEVNRVLRPGGHFLFTDFRYDYEWPALDGLLRQLGMIVLMAKDITHCIVKALEFDDVRRRTLINQLVPRPFRKLTLKFAGNVGSGTYESFVNRRYVYQSYILQKPL
jgi:SAM-dependent methyltransferase